MGPRRMGGYVLDAESSSELNENAATEARGVGSGDWAGDTVEEEVEEQGRREERRGRRDSASSAFAWDRGRADALMYPTLAPSRLPPPAEPSPGNPPPPASLRPLVITSSFSLAPPGPGLAPARSAPPARRTRDKEDVAADESMLLKPGNWRAPLRFALLRPDGLLPKLPSALLPCFSST